MGFVDKLKLNNNVYCYILEGQDMHGGEIFSYVAVHANQERDFEVAVKTRGFSPEEFGAKVIFAAKGKLTPEIKEYVEEKYIKAEGVEALD